MTSPVMWDVVGHLTAQTLRPGALGLPPHKTLCGKPLESKVFWKMAPVWLPRDPYMFEENLSYIFACVKCSLFPVLSLPLNVSR